MSAEDLLDQRPMSCTNSKDNKYDYIFGCLFFILLDPFT